MAFELYVPEKKPGKTYYGFRVADHCINVGIKLGRELKDENWKYCKLFYDRERGEVKIVKSKDRRDIEVDWCVIRGKLGEVMPKVRYYVIEVNKHRTKETQEYTLSKSNRENE